MCGIFGAVLAHELATEQWTRHCTDTMSHRGPDGSGVYVSGGVGLGHRRLSIIDLGGGAQPIVSEDAQVVIVFNGEIYNYRELRVALEARGHRFRTNSDTEVILRQYLDEGQDCVKRLRGMFAFAIWDARTQELFVARDRLGIKPLYYLHRDGRFIFASEVKAILATGHYRATADLRAVEAMLTVSFTPSPLSMFEGILKLPAGHVAVIGRDASVRIREYWTLFDTKPSQRPASRKDMVDAFREKLRETVESHLVADVPVGAFLSGGLDSSTIVAMMSAVQGANVKTFAVGYRDDPAASELPYAREVAQAFGTDHHEYILEPDDFMEALDVFLTYGEEPIGEPQSIAFYRLSKLARNDVKVMLSGEGMDECLAGYGSYSSMARIEQLNAAARWTGTAGLLRAAARATKREKTAKYLDWIGTPFEQRYLGVNSTMTAGLRERVFGPAIESQSWVGERIREIRERGRADTLLRRMSATDLLTWMPDNSLLRSDKMTMAASIELRVPFLDHEFVEMAYALPDDAKLGPAGPKSILREAMLGILPERILRRPKVGFAIPIDRWFRGALRERLADILLGQRFRERGYVKPAYLNSLLADPSRMTEDNASRVFRMLMLALWHEKYIDGISLPGRLG